MQRLGWQAQTATVWLNEHGQHIDVQEYSAAYVEKLALLATQAWVSRQVAKATARPDLAPGVWWAPLAAAVKRVPAAAAAYLRRVWAGAEHAQADLCRYHRAEGPECRCCGAVGTLQHRHWCCDQFSIHRQQLEPEAE